MKTLKIFMIIVGLATSLNTQAALVGSFIKLLTDSARQADRAALIAKHVVEGEVGRYEDNISRAIFGLTGATDRNPSAEQVLEFINGSSLSQAEKEMVTNILKKSETEITANDLDIVTRELRRAAHSIDPNGVIIRTCESSCIADGSRLTDELFVVDVPQMRDTLKRYKSPARQRSQIQSNLRRSSMGRMGASASFITNNGADTQYMLLFTEALKDGSPFPKDTISFAKAILEFSKKPDGTYDLFDVANAQRLYRLLVEIDSADHGSFAKNFNEIASACAGKYPKKDCFFQEMEKVAKRDNPDLSAKQIEDKISGMKAKGCFFD